MPSKTHITIAIEPCGEFCNEIDGHECPFLMGLRPTSADVWKNHCRVFGDIGDLVSGVPAKRHEGCVEAQKNYEEKR